MRTPRILFLIALTCVCAGPRAADSVAGESVAPEELLFQQIPNVVSASRSEQSVQKAPSVITVWTADDIRRMGLRNLKEVFDRTVGFFSNRQYASPVFGARGLIADGNEAFLFLIDGHNINSIVQKGAACYYLLPALDKVKRVEIIRGPGSTLWGGDAAMAVINVITKTGGDINGLQVSADYATADRQKTANILYGKELDKDRSVMFSYTLSSAYGFPDDPGYAAVFPGPYARSDYSTNPAVWWGNDGRGNGKVGPLDSMAQSYEFYAKARLDDITLTGLMSDVFNNDLWQRNGDRNRQYFGRRRTSYLEMTHRADVSDSLSLETKLYTDFIQSDDHMYNILTAPGFSDVNEEKCSKEQRVGVDMIARKNIRDIHALTFGMQAAVTELDPIFTYQNMTTSSGTLYANVIPQDYDNVFAVFAEDRWSITERFDLIGGLRADNNNLRENKTVLLPRFGAVYELTRQSTLKYLYNTGYVRPPANAGSLGQSPRKLADDRVTVYRELGADKAEEIQTHDLQWSFTGDRIGGSVTLYQTTLKNYFNYSGKFTTADGNLLNAAGAVQPTVMADGQLYRLAIINANTITSTGAELDFRASVSKAVMVYGNAAQVISSKVDQFGWSVRGYDGTLQGSGLFTNDKNVTAFPCLSWNAGVTLQARKDCSVNLHYRGWTSMWTLSDDSTTPVTYVQLGPEHFVDANILFDNIARKPLSLALYAKNLFNNNTSRIGFVSHGGYWTDRALSVGARVSYRFDGM